MRVYSWARPTLSLGRNQTARGHYDLARAQDAGVDFVRRPTGGRAVLHHREVTYSVTAPAAALGTARESYARINRLLLSSLRSLGVEAAVAGRRARALVPGIAPCFDLPGEGELTAGGAKLVGSAQWRDAAAMLQHGSILVEDDQALAASLLNGPASPPPPAASLRALLGRAPSVSDLAVAVRTAIVTMEDPDASALVVDTALGRRIADERARFLDEQWTWRR